MRKRYLDAQLQGIKCVCIYINTDNFVRICTLNFWTKKLLLHLLLVVPCLAMRQDYLLWGFYFFSQWLSLWSSEWRKSVEHFKEKVIMNIECQYNQHSCPGSYEAACLLCLWVLCSLLIWSNCNNCQTGVSALIMFWAWLKHKTQINMFTSQNPFLDHPDTWIISVVSMVVHQRTTHVGRNYFDWA